MSYRQLSLLVDEEEYSEEYDNIREDLGAVASEVINETIVAGTDWTTETIASQIEKGNIILNPKFQRRDAWTRKKKSLFIESVFLGLPVPQIVLAESKDKKGKYVVIDGKQRLLSIMQFCSRGGSEYSPLKLTGLELLSEFNNKTYSDIYDEANYQFLLDSFDNQTVRTVVVKNWNTEDLLYRIFLRLNTGSVGLSPQELRQALHPGPFIEYADDYSIDSRSLREIFNNDGPDFRMRDIELFIRYVAYSLFIESYAGNLKAFLDTACDVLNKTWDINEYVVRSLSGDFEEGCNFVISVFKANSFRKWSGERYEKQFNRAIFDVMLFYFKNHDVRTHLSGKESDIENLFKTILSENDKFVQSVERTTKSVDSTFSRLSIWGQALRDVLHAPVVVPELINNRIVFPNAQY